MDGTVQPFKVTRVDSVRAVHLEGELDLASADELSEVLRDCTAPGGPLVVDATGLSYLDSTGIHVLLRAAKLVTEGGWCVYLHIDDGIVEEVLRLTGMNRIPHIHVIDHRGFKAPNT
jgi:anti-sigma B factor antagonist